MNKKKKEWQLNVLDDNMKWRLTIQNESCLVLMFNEVCLGDLRVSEVKRQRVFNVKFLYGETQSFFKRGHA